MTLYVFNPFTNNLDAIGDNNFADPVPVADGGTGRSSFTAFAVITGGTTSSAPLQDVGSLGTSGQVLTSAGAGALPTWQTNAGGDVTGPASATNNDIVTFNGTTGKLIKDSGVAFPIPVGSGGTGTNTLTIHGVVIGNTTSAVNVTAAGATGAVFMGSTGADPSFTTTPTIAGATTISGSLTMNGGMIQKRTATAVSYGVLVTDVIIAVTDTTAARTMTMPNSGLVSGQRWTIKDESGGAATHAITISGNGANVDGAASQVMNTNYGSVDIYCNGTNFFLV